MIVEVVPSRNPKKQRVEVVSPEVMRITPNSVRHHRTHAHPIVCVECNRAIALERAHRNDVGEWVCKDRACT